jgi:predicted DsbA family dithiol-disulfide isomerase
MSAKAEILGFTDPFCSWCWATEPALLTLRERYRDQLAIHWVMGGLVKDMSAFFDSANGIGTTAEVAPHWRTVSERSGQPIDERLMTDITDAHWSTWPANVAVKAAMLQSPEVGDRYLRRLRRAALTERVQVQRQDAQLELAREVPGLDLEAFRRALGGEEASKAFRDDLALCAAYGVTGFPTMLFKPAANDEDRQAILVGGHRPLATYESVLAKVAPGLTRHAPRAVEVLLAEYGPLTSRELGEILGQSTADAERDLRAQATGGRIEAVDLRGGTLWALPGAG